jgi:drug/metabolite transporter (DMT)-like permease
VFFAGAWLQQEGIKTASVTNTGFLTALYVVITPFVAWMAMGRVPSWLVWPAVVLSALGTWLLGGGSIGAFSRGDGLVALSAFFWAGHVVMTGSAARYRRPIGFTVVQFALVGVLAAVVVKLFAVDLAGVGTVGRIVSFLGVGLLMLLIGYLSPVPPQAREGGPEG